MASDPPPPPRQTPSPTTVTDFGALARKIKISHLLEKGGAGGKGLAKNDPLSPPSSFEVNKSFGRSILWSKSLIEKLTRQKQKHAKQTRNIRHIFR